MLNPKDDFFIYLVPYFPHLDTPSGKCFGATVVFMDGDPRSSITRCNRNNSRTQEMLWCKLKWVWWKCGINTHRWGLAAVLVLITAYSRQQDPPYRHQIYHVALCWCYSTACQANDSLRKKLFRCYHMFLCKASDNNFHFHIDLMDSIIIAT